MGALELQKALAIDPNYAEAHANLGATYLHMGRIDEGATELRRAIARQLAVLLRQPADAVR